MDAENYLTSMESKVRLIIEFVGTIIRVWELIWNSFLM